MDTRRAKRPLLKGGNDDDNDFESPPKKRTASTNASLLEEINKNRAKIALLNTPTKRKKVDETQGKNIGMPKGTPKRIQPTASINIEPLEDKVTRTSPPPRVLRRSASPGKLTPSPLKPSQSPSKKSSPRPEALKLKVKVADKRNDTPSRNTPSIEVDKVSQSGIEEASPRRNLRSSLSPNKKVVPLEKSTPQRNMKSRPKKKSLSRRTEDKDEEERTSNKSRIATAMTKKAKTNKHNTTFRSGLSSMVNLFKELNDHRALRVDHNEKMKSTPFGSLYSIFNDGKFLEDDVQKPAGAIISILGSYSRKDNVFSIGGKLVKFQVRDVDVIFGLPACGKKPRLNTRTVSENCQSDFVNRYWPDCKIITLKLLTSAIRGVAHKVTKKDVEDFCKMVIMFMLLTIFNPGNGAGIRLSCIPLIDDFEGLGKLVGRQSFMKLWMPKSKTGKQQNPLA